MTVATRVVMRSLKTPQPPEVEQHRGGEAREVQSEGLAEAEQQLQGEGGGEAMEGVEVEELEAQTDKHLRTCTSGW